MFRNLIKTCLNIHIANTKSIPAQKSLKFLYMVIFSFNIINTIWVLFVAKKTKWFNSFSKHFQAS